MLGKATIDTKTHGQTKGKSGSYSTNFQMSGRELLTPDEVRKAGQPLCAAVHPRRKPGHGRKVRSHAPSGDLAQLARRRSALHPSWNQTVRLHRPSAVPSGQHRTPKPIEGGISLKKPFESKAKRLYSIFASVFFMLAVFVVPAFAADGDPLAVVNNLSDFIFSAHPRGRLDPARLWHFAGWPVSQVARSVPARKRHPDRRGRHRHYIHQGDPDADHRLIKIWGERKCSPRLEMSKTGGRSSPQTRQMGIKRV